MALDRPLRLLYAGGHVLIREVIAATLRDGGIEVTEARSVPEALELLSTNGLLPDAVLLDDDAVGPDAAVDALTTILSVAPGIHVGILSASSLALYPARALRAGASAFLTKDTPRDELTDAVTRFCRGELVVDPAIARTMFSLVGDKPPGPQPVQTEPDHELRLTPTEKKVMELAAEGLMVKQIALRLGLSPLTVKNHLARIRRRLGATDKAHAVATALRAGLVR